MTGPQLPAAMEPVLGGRDDAPMVPSPGTSPTTRAAMEPVLGGRDDLDWDQYLQWLSGPQWSPSLADGTTQQTSAREGGRIMPQWRPSLADGTTSAACRSRCRASAAAMEPVLGGRDDTGPAGCSLTTVSCRNGARPWRTGRPDRPRGCGWPGARPQWSPSLADGTTAGAARPGPDVDHAAMEPVLGGRDDVTARTACPRGWQPQWSPPLADGTTSRSAASRATLAAPQWSPSLADGTTQRQPICPLLSALPQWSPSLADGTTVSPAVNAGAAGLPQWSPSLADGTT